MWTQITTERRNKAAPSKHWWIVLSLMVLASGTIAHENQLTPTDSAIRAVKRHLGYLDIARDLLRQADKSARFEAHLTEAAAAATAA